MEWGINLIKDYLTERDNLLNQRWSTYSSWNQRSKIKTRYNEISRLLDLESKFNQNCLNKINQTIVKYRLKKSDLEELVLLICTHTTKHKERNYFLVAIALTITILPKLLGADLILSYALGFFGLLIIAERISASKVIFALDELKAQVELAIENM